MPKLGTGVLLAYIFKLLARQLIWVTVIYQIYLQLKVIFVALICTNLNYL